MKPRTVAPLILLALLAGCASIMGGLNEQEGKERWPVSVVSWESVMARVDSAEVVIVCLVDEYDQSNLDMPREDPGPHWYPPTKRYSITPAQVLASWLRGVRSLEGKEIMTPTGESEPRKMAIYIVEGHDKTREWAGELFEKNGVHYYDRSIPVIYVFRNKQLMTSYTYMRNPGSNGATLKNVVRDVFKIS